MIAMKRFRGLCLILLLAVATFFCMTACGSETSGEDGKEDPSGTKVSYEITVNTGSVSVDMGEISVLIYSLDGASVGEKKLTNRKAQFELEAGSYVATLGGLSEEVSYSSVLLTKEVRKATIALENAQYDIYSETYSFAFTLIVFAGDMDLSSLTVQWCDESLCRDVQFTNGNVAHFSVSTGECEVKFYTFSEGGLEEIHHENYTVTTDKRFCVIAL